MSIREILKMGDPRLLRVAEPVKEFDTPELHALIADMFETMHAANGAGLAAPQIGVNLQLVIFGFKQNQRYPDAPRGAGNGADQPGAHAAVGRDGRGLRRLPVGARPARQRAALYALRYEGVDQYGKPIRRDVDGFHARVVQHEVDHLLGILYPMRIKDFSRFGYTEVMFPDLDPKADD
jgi:peptide deformylase